MPTPLGHALGGLAAGWSIAGGGSGRSSRRRAITFAALGALADIDLLFHAHSTYTHSIGAALLAALLAFAFRRETIFALACGAAYGSHVLLDWLGTDTSPPFGITALWPFSSAFYYSGVDLFPTVDRRYWLPGFWQRAVHSVTIELIILLPITALVLWLRARRARDVSPQHYA
jgi:membrane-bound metal-dependent hydrolase YbcI (DUF457 family)